MEKQKKKIITQKQVKAIVQIELLIVVASIGYKFFGKLSNNQVLLVFLGFTLYTIIVFFLMKRSNKKKQLCKEEISLKYRDYQKFTKENNELIELRKEKMFKESTLFYSNYLYNVINWTIPVVFTVLNLVVVFLNELGAMLTVFLFAFEFTICYFYIFCFINPRKEEIMDLKNEITIIDLKIDYIKNK
ncbi:MAG: hypothetical protein EUB_03498 [Eubacterium sp.]|uniref:hypothetical protein n=1 Tax=Eubacterium sp. TaxID=142586 RepID=UPI00305CE28E